MAYTFFDLAYEILKKTPVPLDYREIWKQALNQDLAKKVKSRGQTPWATVGARLSSDILNNPDSKFIAVGANPKKYFLKERENELEGRIGSKLFPLENEVIERPTKFSYKESQLHRLLSYFVYSNPEFFSDGRIYTKTIRDRKSKGGALREWLHPDMVGVYFPFGDLQERVVETNRLLSQDSLVKIFSFELKRSLEPGNYRQHFFQAVSNSSWAHEGYLVAAEISEKADLHKELSRLSNAFGICIVHLELKDINASRVLYNASSKSELDWETINKLYELNEDFFEFIDNLKSDISALRVNVAEYENILSDPTQYIQKELKIDSAE